MDAVPAKEVILCHLSVRVSLSSRFPSSLVYSERMGFYQKKSREAAHKVTETQRRVQGYNFLFVTL